MSSNFHNFRGFHIAGLELHDYVAAPAIPKPLHPHISGPFMFNSLTATQWKAAWKVTAEAAPMMEQGYDFYLVTHLPIPVPPPGPPEALKLALTIVDSGSKLWMGVHSVTTGGNALAVTTEDPTSANMNCSDPFDVPNNAVLNFNSVKTTPTAGDVVGGVVGWMFDALQNIAITRATKRVLSKGGEEAQEKAVRAIKHVWRRAPDVISPLNDALSFPSKTAQEWVDAATGAGR